MLKQTTLNHASLDAFETALAGYHFRTGVQVWHKPNVDRVNLSYVTVDDMPVADLEKKLAAYDNRRFFLRWPQRWFTNIEKQRALLLYYYCREYTEVSKGLLKFDGTKVEAEPTLWTLTLHARYELAKIKIAHHAKFLKDRSGHYKTNGLSRFSRMHRILDDYPEKASTSFERRDLSQATLQSHIQTMEQIYLQAKKELAEIQDTSNIAESRRTKTTRIVNDYETYLSLYYTTTEVKKAPDSRLTTFLKQACQLVKSMLDKKSQYFEGTLSTGAFKQDPVYQITFPCLTTHPSGTQSGKTEENNDLNQADKLPIDIHHQPASATRKKSNVSDKEALNFASLTERWEQSDKEALESFLKETRQKLLNAPESKYVTVKEQAERDLRKYCHKLFLIYHPDRNPNEKETAETIFKIIDTCYKAGVDTFETDENTTKQNYQTGRGFAAWRERDAALLARIEKIRREIANLTEFWCITYPVQLAEIEDELKRQDGLLDEIAQDVKKIEASNAEMRSMLAPGSALDKLEQKLLGKQKGDGAAASTSTQVLGTGDVSLFKSAKESQANPANVQQQSDCSHGAPGKS